MPTIADLVNDVEDLKTDRDQLRDRVDKLEATVIRVTFERDTMAAALKNLTNNVTSWPARLEAERLVRADARP